MRGDGQDEVVRRDDPVERGLRRSRPRRALVALLGLSLVAAAGCAGVRLETGVELHSRARTGPAQYDPAPVVAPAPPIAPGSTPTPRLRQ